MTIRLRKSIVLTFDGLPVRLLGCYGNLTASTPTFDVLAAQSVVFDQCFRPFDRERSPADSTPTTAVLATAERLRSRHTPDGSDSCDTASNDVFDAAREFPPGVAARSIAVYDATGIASAIDAINRMHGQTSPQILSIRLPAVVASAAESMNTSAVSHNDASPDDVHESADVDSPGGGSTPVTLDEADAALETLLGAIDRLESDCDCLIVVTARDGGHVDNDGSPAVCAELAINVGPPGTIKIQPGPLCDDLVMIPLIVYRSDGPVHRSSMLTTPADGMDTLVAWTHGTENAPGDSDAPSWISNRTSNRNDGAAEILIGDDQWIGLRTHEFAFIANRDAVIQAAERWMAAESSPETSSETVVTDLVERGQLFVKPDDAFHIHNAIASSPEAARTAATHLIRTIAARQIES